MKVTVSPSETLACVQRLTLFSDVCPADCSTIISAAREKRFTRRETIFFEGDPVQQIVMLLSGCVKITQLGFGGDEVILRLSGVGDVVGGSRLSANHFSTAQAVQPSSALVWQVAAFERLLEHFPAFRRNTLRALQECLQEMEQRFREVSTENVGSRLSTELLRFSNQLVGANGKAEIGLSRWELAQLTGTTMFSVSRLFSRWQTLGIVSSRREAVQVHDFAALAQFSQRE